MGIFTQAIPLRVVCVFGGTRKLDESRVLGGDLSETPQTRDYKIILLLNEEKKETYRMKKALQVVALAALMFACLFGFAWIQYQRGCPLTQVNCVYVVEK